MKISLIIGIKNRSDHFFQTLPFMLSQVGVNYELIIVDFFSKPEFYKRLHKELEIRKETRSSCLKKIKLVSVLEDLKYNPRKCKNLGAKIAKGDILAFSDADVFLSQDYLFHWRKTIYGENFMASRIQETMGSKAKRISKEINYGNLVVHRDDFMDCGGWDESIATYGGDDDDMFHRLKLYGLREINPYNEIEAKQWSILHGDELRLSQFENTKRVDSEKEFERIYSNSDFINTNNSFFKYKNYRIETL